MLWGRSGGDALTVVFQAVHSRADIHGHLDVALVGEEADFVFPFVCRVDVQRRCGSVATRNHSHVDVGNLGQRNAALEPAESAVQDDRVVRDDDALHGKPHDQDRQKYDATPNGPIGMIPNGGQRVSEENHRRGNGDFHGEIRRVFGLHGPRRAMRSNKLSESSWPAGIES